MTTLGPIAAGVAAAALWTATASGLPPRAPVAEDPLDHFYTALDSYVALRQAVERSMPPLEITPDGENIHAAIEAMGAAMRAARPSAAEGDIFDVDAAPVVRGIVQRTARDAECDVAGMLAAQADEPLTLSVPRRPLVHDRFDWTAGSFMPGCLLEVLPALPDELHYYLVGRDLVLVDIDADLIVDVLPDALPPGEFREGIVYV